MTMLFFLKPIIHEGPGADLDNYDAPKKKKKRKKRKLTKKFVESVATALELKPVDVQPYIEDIFRREEELEQLRERMRVEEQEQAERKAEAEERQRVSELIEQIGQMAKRSLAAKRKRLNTLIASILDWL